METGSVVCEFAFVFLCSENPKAEKQDTFVEKLVTQVIKNLQVKISNIHVRYEDDVSTSAWSFYILKTLNILYCIVLYYWVIWLCVLSMLPMCSDHQSQCSPFIRSVPAEPQSPGMPIITNHKYIDSIMRLSNLLAMFNTQNQVGKITFCKNIYIYFL